MTIVYIIPSARISGGVAVVLQHAMRMSGDEHIIQVISMDKTSDVRWFPYFSQVNVIGSHDSEIDGVIDSIAPDIVIATAWNTVDVVLRTRCKRRAYFVQSDERRFTADRQLVEKIHKTYTHKDLEYLTEALWIQRWLYDEFSHNAYYVPNGLDQNIFYEVDGLRNGNRKRVLLEGAIDLPYKRMGDAYEAVQNLDCDIWIVSSRGRPPREWRYDEFFSAVPMEKMKYIYSSCDVFLKMSNVEGFFGPPMESMACGTPVVVSRCTGHDEFIRHEENALSVDVGDIKLARMYVQRLLSDDDYANRIAQSGRMTAREWLWERSMQFMQKFIYQEGANKDYLRFNTSRYTYEYKEVAQ